MRNNLNSSFFFEVSIQLLLISTLILILDVLHIFYFRFYVNIYVLFAITFILFTTTSILKFKSKDKNNIQYYYYIALLCLIIFKFVDVLYFNLLKSIYLIYFENLLFLSLLLISSYFKFLSNSYLKFNFLDINLLFLNKYKLNYWIISIILLFLVGLIIRVFLIYLNMGKSLWYDEAITLYVIYQIIDGNGQTFHDGTFYNRAIIYHHLLALLVLIFKNPYIVGISFNLIFYSISFFGLYKLSLKLTNKLTTLFTLFLFSTSTFMLYMFLEIRFYEFFVSFFILTTFFLYLIIEEYFKFDNFKSFFNSLILFDIKVRRFLIYFTLFCISLVISIDAHRLTFYLLYATLIFGFSLLIVRKYLEGIIISLFSFFILLLGNIYLHKEQFSFSYLLVQPLLPWMQYQFGYQPALTFFNRMLLNEFQYIIILLPILVILLILKIKEIKILYLFSIGITLFIMISIQGYGMYAVRYFHFVYPFILIIIAYTINEIINYKHSKVSSILVFTLVGIILSSSLFNLYSTFNEHANPLSDSREAFKFIEENFNIDEIYVYSDGQLILSYYIHFKQFPDIVISTLESEKSTDYYSGVEIYGFDIVLEKIEHISQETIFMFRTDKRPSIIYDNIFVEFEVIYENDTIKLIRLI